MIRMIHEKGVRFPRPFCDHCGGQLIDMGIVTTAGDGHGVPADALIFLHKGSCDQAWFREGDGTDGWIELDWLPLQLLLNIHPSLGTRQQIHSFIDRRLDESELLESLR